MTENLILFGIRDSMDAVVLGFLLLGRFSNARCQPENQLTIKTYTTCTGK